PPTVHPGHLARLDQLAYRHPGLHRGKDPIVGFPGQLDSVLEVLVGGPDREGVVELRDISAPSSFELDRQHIASLEISERRLLHPVVRVPEWPTDPPEHWLEAATRIGVHEIHPREDVALGDAGAGMIAYGL